jgi:hypothetical protein
MSSLQWLCVTTGADLGLMCGSTVPVRVAERATATEPLQRSTTTSREDPNMIC